MRTFYLLLSLFCLPSLLASDGPSVVKGPSSLLYPDFWHTPMGIHRGTPQLLRVFLGDRVQFDDPEGLACTRMKENGPENPQLTVFGVNSGAACIVYNPDMLSLDLLGRPGTGQGEFMHPGGIAALPDGRVAVADTGNNRVVLLQYSHKKLSWEAALGHEGKGPGEFEKPSWLAYDSQGRLYVSDTGNNRIQVFSDDLKYIFSFGDDPDANNSLIEPQAIAVVDPKEPNSAQPQAAIFVVDQFHGRIQKFDLSGRFLGQASGLDADRYLVYFSGIALDYYNNLWVVDRGNNQIHKFDTFLQYLDSWGEKGEGDYHLNSPRGLAIYRHYGQVFVAEKTSVQYLWIGSDVKDIKVSSATGADGHPAMRVDYQLTDNADVECWVERAESEDRLATLQERRKMHQGLQSLAWDGHCLDSGLIQPGAYRLVFEAEASYSSATYFKKRAEKKFWVK